MNYLIDKADLNSLVIFNGLIGEYLQRASTSEQLKVWDNLIFNELLIKQPELKKEYNLFSERFEEVKYKNSLFSDIFKEKIELKNAVHFLFTSSPHYGGGPDNKFKFFINLVAKSPDFLKMFHQAIQKNSGDDYPLFDAYFKLIKADVTIPKNEVWENIKKFQTDSELKKDKKKILAYLTFEKDKQLYEFIMDDMAQSFAKSPLLTEYWENKLKLFPIDIRQDFTRRKVDANPFTDEEQIGYKFTLDKEWIMTKFKLGPTIAGEFRSIFYTGLSESLNKKFKTSDGSFSGEGIRIGCTSPENLQEVKSFCRRLVPEIYSIFQNFNFNNGPMRGAAEACEIIDKFAFTDSLYESLPSKPEFSPKRKI